MREAGARWAGLLLAAALAGGHAASPPSVAASAVCPSPTLERLIAAEEPPGPLSVEFRPVGGLYAEAGAECWSGIEIELTGFVAGPEGLGGASSWSIEPLWLVSRAHWLSTSDEIDPEIGPRGPFFPVAVPPALDARFAALQGRWVRVSGHFSDPIAETCAVEVGQPSLGPAPSPEQGIAICRTSFVVTSVEVLAQPPTDTAPDRATPGPVRGWWWAGVIGLLGGLGFALALWFLSRRSTLGPGRAR